jgi:hypothetical protein
MLLQSWQVRSEVMVFDEEVGGNCANFKALKSPNPRYRKA